MLNVVPNVEVLVCLIAGSRLRSPLDTLPLDSSDLIGFVLWMIIARHQVYNCCVKVISVFVRYTCIFYNKIVDFDLEWLEYCRLSQLRSYNKSIITLIHDRLCFEFDMVCHLRVYSVPYWKFWHIFKPGPRFNTNKCFKTHTWNIKCLAICK